MKLLPLSSLVFAFLIDPRLLLASHIATERVTCFASPNPSSHRLQVRPVHVRTRPIATATDWLPLHEQISLALEAEGYRVETRVGSSDFRLPVAIVSRGDSTRYALAILCEDGSRSEVDIYQSHIHIPNVLAQRHWHTLRLHSRQWHLYREETLATLAG